MLSTWLLLTILSTIFSVIYFQTFKFAVKHAKDDGAVIILLQFIAGLSAWVFFPFFPLHIPTDVRFYFFLGLSCIFYAISDRASVPARKNLPVSTFSIINQLTSVFLVVIGLLIFKDPFVISKIVGALFILGANIFIFYDKGKFIINKSVVFGLLSTIALATALSIDIGISRQFNLAFYSGLIFVIPAFLIMLAQRISFPSMKTELKKAPFFYLVTGFFWGMTLLTILRAYQLGQVSIIVPLGATSVLVNVLVAHVLLGERKNVGKKIIAALLVILGIFLTVR